MPPSAARSQRQLLLKPPSKGGLSMRDASRSLGDQIYRLLVEAVVDYAIYFLDTKGRINSWNPGAQRLKGYSAAEVMGKHFSLFFTEEDRRNGRPEAALERTRRDGRFESEGWRVRKDGSRFWALTVLDLVRDDAGHPIGFAKITRDMTQRHEAHQALLESERRFRLLVQGVTDYALFMLDQEGKITNWKPGAAKMKGYTAEEVIGHHFSRFYTEEDRAAGLPARALAQARATGRFEAEGWRVRKDGGRFWASVVIDAIRDEDGNLLGFAKITRDITERREAQRAVEEMRTQLVQAQKLEALGQLTGGIAHDFNNLLEAIIGGVALAEKLVQEDEKLASILAEMRRAARRGAALTRQLLAFSRRAPTQPETIAIASGLRQAVGLFSHTLRGDIEVTLRLEDDIWPIHADPAQFELALLNVAVNARDAMPRGGSLTVSARNRVLDGEPDGLRGRFVAVTLRDTGEGIPEEVLGRVFEPFFTTKPLGKGTGLGLSQAYGFARQAGGTVMIESEPGHGTAITFLLPAARDGEVADTTGPAPSPVGATGNGAKVLVVDDDPVVGQLAAEMLESAGYRAVAVAEPEAALDRLGGDEQFDAVLSDVLMPGSMNGVDLAREIRRRWPDLPVLLASGYAGSVDAEWQGFPILHKPFATSELAVAIATLLAQQRHKQYMP